MQRERTRRRKEKELNTKERVERNAERKRIKQKEGKLRDAKAKKEVKNKASWVVTFL
jgi:hypothetical protein